MRIQICPLPNVVLDELFPVAPLLWDAAELGTAHVQEYAGWQGTAIDFALAPNLFRSRFKRHLRDHGHEVSDFEAEDVPNNGLLMRHGRYALNVLKSDVGALPPPGFSDRKRAFYDQRYLADPAQTELQFPEAEFVLPDTLNVIVLWLVKWDYALDKLVLAVPRFGLATRLSVDAFWYEEIPHPALELTPPDSPSGGPKSDLPMTLIPGSVAKAQ